MNVINKTMLGVVFGLATLSATAAPIYVGSFNVFDGPVGWSSPQPLSARQVAAMLFGGAYADYAVSIDSSLDASTITHTAWLDGYGDVQYLLSAADEDFVSAPPSGLYDDFSAYSAWVCDHADCVDDGFPQNEGWPGFNYTNYVWKLDAGTQPPSDVPEPGTLALMASFVGIGVGRRLLGKR
jgi:hypothetical protein